MCVVGGTTRLVPLIQNFQWSKCTLCVSDCRVGSEEHVDSAVVHCLTFICPYVRTYQHCHAGHVMYTMQRG